jgi:hypothetical protein
MAGIVIPPSTFPTSPNPTSSPFHSPHLLKASTQSIINARNQDFECCFFTVVSVFDSVASRKASCAPPQKGSPERLIRNLTLYYNLAHDTVQGEPFPLL